MATFARILGALLWMLPLAPVHMARAQGAPTAPPERFAGEARLGSHPPLPVHVELDRAGVPVTGTITIPGSSFELGDAKGTGTVVARFRGAGGSGAITLRTDGDLLIGEFELEGQSGTIAAQRTHQDAGAFLRPPEQRMDLTERQWLDDLDRLVDILEREHAAPFHRVSAERFEHEAGQVRAAIPALDAVSIALEFRRLGALIGDAHTSVDLPHARPRLPIDLYWFEDGLRVVGLPAQHRDLVGARLIAVDEVPAAAIEQRLRAYIAQGETEWHYRARMPDLAKDPDVLRAIGLGAAPSFSFTLETGGRQAHVVLSAGEADEPPAEANLNPFWERNPGQGFWHELLADGSVYVNWRSYDGLAAQSADLMRRLDAKHPRRLIVDLRDKRVATTTSVVRSSNRSGAARAQPERRALRADRPEDLLRGNDECHRFQAEDRSRSGRRTRGRRTQQLAGGAPFPPAQLGTPGGRFHPLLRIPAGQPRGSSRPPGPARAGRLDP